MPELSRPEIQVIHDLRYVDICQWFDGNWYKGHGGKALRPANDEQPVPVSVLESLREKGLIMLEPTQYSALAALTPAGHETAQRLESQAFDERQRALDAPTDRHFDRH
jgi:hypothetical protein